ncbi:hypothetical protein FBEOM_10021 [Fusarium beomiforme]|uniref:Uncharacterized protein n=1 Tax=Fusarium beomiforme TaxID=44412 RepID=A0A9P5DUN0_9HYPO|nr:hypothetical protein FBEOM_10021 [Fusarium beomiforme]
MDFAKIQPFIKSRAYLEPIDTNDHTLSDDRPPSPSPITPNDPSTLRFSSNAGIIEHYSRSWSAEETRDEQTQNGLVEFEQLVGPISRHTPRWPFINDDSLNTPDSVDAEPLFTSSRSSVTKPRQIYQIQEGLEDLADLYVPILDSVPESPEVKAPPPPPPVASRLGHGKVMTTAEFEALQKRKAREDAERRFYGGEEEEDDKVDYECIDDTDALNKQRAQRKKQQAYLDGSYRQRMMKSTNGPDLPPLRSHTRVSSSWSMKSFKTFQGLPEDAIPRCEPEVDDDDVPLALLPIQRNSGGKAPSVVFSHGRGDSFSQLQSINIRQNTRTPVPAFERNLPQIPYPETTNLWPLNNQQHITGGLVAVIAAEERAKNERRVPPSHGFQPLPDTNNAFTWRQPAQQQIGIAQPFGMAGTQTPMVFSRPQTPVAVPRPPPFPSNNDMLNLLQAQNEFMRSMVTMNQRGNQPWDQQLVMNGGVPGVRSIYAPSQYAPSNYARSNYARSNYASSLYAKPVYQQQSGGYAASVAPSERNTVGLPSRYRPVSKATTPVRSSKVGLADDNMSFKNWENGRSNVPRASAVLDEDSTDDDDEAFWRAKKEKRDKRRAMWIQKNDLGIKPEWII